MLFLLYIPPIMLSRHSDSNVLTFGEVENILLIQRHVDITALLVRRMLVEYVRGIVT